MAKRAKSVSVQQKMLTIYNRNNYRVELVLNGKAVVLLGGESTQVPEGSFIPANLGIIVR